MGYKVFFYLIHIGKFSKFGTGIVIKFSSLIQVQRYISENYLSDGDSSILCQIQYVEVELNSSQTSLTQKERYYESIKRKRQLIKDSQPELHQDMLKR